KQEQENLVRNINFFQNRSGTENLFDFPNITKINKEFPHPPEVYFLQSLINPKSISYLTEEQAAVLLTRQNKILQTFKVFDANSNVDKIIKTFTEPVALEKSSQELWDKLQQSKEANLIRNLQSMAFLAQISCSSPWYRTTNYEPALARDYEQTSLPISFVGIDSEGFARCHIVWRNPGMNHFPSSLIHFKPDLENFILTNADSHYESLIENLPRTATNDKRLQSSKLLYYFSENLMKIDGKKDNTHHAFFRVLFQPDFDFKKDPPIFEALKDPAFVKQLSNFISKGVDFFSTGFFSSKPDIKASLFFARLARRVKEIDPSLPLMDFQDKLNDYLKMPNLSPDETKLIHLHRILQYKGRNKESLTKQELKEIFCSWIFCSKYEFSHSGDGLNQKKEAIRFILSLTSTLKTLSSTDYDEILSIVSGKTLEEINQSYFRKTWVSTQFPVYQKGPWNINVLTGELTENNELLEFENNIYLPKLESHKRVFGDMDFPKTKKGDSYFFTDTKTNLRYQHIYKDEKVLQIEIDGKWYQYKNPRLSDLNKFPIPDFLKTFHIFTNGSCAVFLDKKSRTLAFSINEYG
ncbi:MAG: hypothetical protein JSS09_00430, partial [Verrucomicrobia bacterium]|nr:hypothetical protein [Verrucomicrobiota bacterium]